MRIFLILGVILLLGIGEYAFVTIAPHPPERRKAELQQMPVVRQFVSNANRERIKAAFERSEEGALVRSNDQDTIRWESPEEVWKDFKAGSFMAIRLVHELRVWEKAHAMLPEAREKAQDGTPWQKYNYLALAQYLDAAEVGHAREMLKADSSATAAYLAAFLHPEEKRFPMHSTEGMVLHALYVAEDLYNPGLTDDQRQDVAAYDSTLLARILTGAEAGQQAAIDALTQLRNDHGIDVNHLVTTKRGSQTTS